MLAEVRSLVALQDLELFDRLVVHHDREAHQAWHGGLGTVPPQCPCSLAAPQIHDPGQSTRALVSLSKCAPLWEMVSYSGHSVLLANCSHPGVAALVLVNLCWSSGRKPVQNWFDVKYNCLR